MANSHDYSDAATTADFPAGAVVWIHPATDTFMRGDRSGVVALRGRKYLTVRLTRSGRKIRFAPSLLAHDTESGQ